MISIPECIEYIGAQCFEGADIEKLHFENENKTITILESSFADSSLKQIMNVPENWIFPNELIFIARHEGFLRRNRRAVHLLMNSSCFVGSDSPDDRRQ